MEQYKLDRDIRALYVTATSFPAGIMDAFDRLHKMVGSLAQKRQVYGISNMNQKGEIVYRAAVEESYPGEAEKLGCEVFTIKKGTYNSIYIQHFREDSARIGRAFQQLLADPRIDAQGACIEVYEGADNVRCMVRLDPSKTETEPQTIKTNEL